jgi:hypothetical protein
VADPRDPEDQLRGIIQTALDRYADDVPLSAVAAVVVATDSVLAALADEIPDGYDDLLRGLAERQPGSQRVRRFKMREAVRVTATGERGQVAALVHGRVGVNFGDEFRSYDPSELEAESG